MSLSTWDAREAMAPGGPYERYNIISITLISIKLWM